LSELSDRSAAEERLERRLAREKAARLQAEAIAERVTSDRWELRQQLEDKLALRTSELEAARRTAAEVVTERERFTSAISHNLRTPLAALFFLADSLSPGEPLEAQRIEDLRSLLSDMRAALNVAGESASSGVGVDVGVGVDAEPAAVAATNSRPSITLADVLSAYEDGWHQLAARSGKLLMLDIETGSGALDAGAADKANQRVLGLIRERVEISEPVIELHLRLGSGGLEGR
jgi:signal transduction histidine kinase